MEPLEEEPKLAADHAEQTSISNKVISGNMNRGKVKNYTIKSITITALFIFFILNIF